MEHVGADNVLRIQANAMLMPVGTTVNRPTGTPGLIRYNSSLGQFEGYNASAWGAIGGIADVSSPFTQANISSEIANAAFLSANTAQIKGNAAHSTANTAVTNASTAQDKGAAAHLHANAAYSTANTAVTNAATAQAKGAAAHETANTIGQSVYTFNGNKTYTGTQTFNNTVAFNQAASFAQPTTFNNWYVVNNSQAVFNWNISTPPANYYNQLQLEIRATSGTAGIGLHRSGFSHVGIYHDTTNVLKFNMSSGTVTLNHNAGTLWGTGNHGNGSGLHADLLDGYHASAFALTTGTVFTGETYCDAGIHATIFRDRNDPWTYYADMNATSMFNDLRANIFYQREDTNAYFARGELRLRGGDPTIRLRDWDNYGCAIHNNSNLLYILGTPVDDPNWRQINGQWPFYFNLSNNDAVCGGTFYAVSNIVAYSSDQRLKENLRHISTPLEKIKSLNGYVFDWKDKVDELGFTPPSKKDDCGLIAQEVQKVVPQAVFAAPFDKQYDANTDSYISKSGEDYLTVQLDKLVPLLVEAIKELSREVDELKSKLK
jgi:hypothetical protein